MKLAVALQERNDLNQKIAQLKYRLELNAVDNLTITELIAKKDVLTSKINSYQSIVNTASNLVGRVSRSEIKVLSNVDVKKIQKEIDKMSKELRIVSNTIEEANWNIEII